MTTLGGGVLPSTASMAIAGLSPLPLFTAASPPLATRYRMTSVPRVSWLPNSNRPSLLVLARASCLGSSALAPQRVEGRIGRRPPARLDLPLDTNGGRSWNTCVAQHADGQQHGGSVDLEHVYSPPISWRPTTVEQASHPLRHQGIWVAVRRSE